MLHVVNKSPFEKDSLATCMRLSRPGSHVLLIEDGVYAALGGGAFAARVRESMAARKFYALGADLAARGLGESDLIDGISVIGYDGFVELAASCSAVQSWV
ncbi:MAG: sulfurtransferase complex subunit TusB [Gammaproteobacteria bacterium]|nr:sulfurtransferase complex subunit TusB [Gammaproteobacteria bacterium]MDA7968259.1 sulfurtransferase complex subunit TusB [Gammaproteobacteria bacterium]MDA7990240.1 sulfurtransferase complex subunit TusB [Gammaproteobacteria bacterium]MDA8007082.1 sulfurtransferase complex subunit TusB [Gammaproteobacteria bacterium]MDA8012194.1 sulfurtransferase complex subunit TusB [Gammaproteobacteria bacterium]